MDEIRTEMTNAGISESDVQRGWSDTVSIDEWRAQKESAPEPEETEEPEEKSEPVAETRPVQADSQQYYIPQAEQQNYQGNPVHPGYYQPETQAVQPQPERTPQEDPLAQEVTEYYQREYAEIKAINPSLSDEQAEIIAARRAGSFLSMRQQQAQELQRFKTELQIQSHPQSAFIGMLLQRMPSVAPEDAINFVNFVGSLTAQQKAQNMAMQQQAMQAQQQKHGATVETGGIRSDKQSAGAQATPQESAIWSRLGLNPARVLQNRRR